MEEFNESAYADIKALLIRLNRRLDKAEAENSTIKGMFEKTMTQMLVAIGKQDKIIKILKELLRRKYVTFDAIEIDENELEERLGVSHSTFYRWRMAEPPENINYNTRKNGRAFYTIKDLQAAIAAKKVPGCIGRLKLIGVLQDYLNGASWPYNVDVDEDLNIID